jgi:hypothetical protein
MKAMLIVAVLGAGALAGCGGGGDDDEDTQLLGPDRSYSKALDIGEEQFTEVMDIADAEGGTPWGDLPNAGSATYDGVITGWADGGAPIDYVADLELKVRFDGNTLNGTIENFVTNGVEGFEHPDGLIRVSGIIEPDEVNEGSLVFTGSGMVGSSDTPAADYFVDATGWFLGDDGRAIVGEHSTDFVWIRGPLNGTTSWSDGVFSGMERD